MIWDFPEKVTNVECGQMNVPPCTACGTLTPVEDLTPILLVGDPRPPDLWDDLDANGMRNPLLCVPMSLDEWAVWCAGHPQAQRVTPAFVNADRGWHVLAVRVGNQRLAWARDRGYTHVPVVVCADMPAAEAWREAHYA